MTHEQVADRRQQAAGGPRGVSGSARLRTAAARPWARELAVPAAFLAAGVAATWPLATYNHRPAASHPGCGRLRLGPVVGRAPGHRSARPVARSRAWAVIAVVAVLGALEAGWPGGPDGVPSMPTSLAALDPTRALSRYLSGTGFRFAYRADGVSVYKPSGSSG